ncbi:MAG: formate/nitrite transporter family protein [Brevinema sp.]
MNRIIVKSLWAGILISLGGTSYLHTINMGNPFIAGLLFTMGLFFISIHGLEIYTGKVALLATKQTTLQELFVILLGNLCATFIVGLVIGYTYPVLQTLSENIIATKTSVDHLRIFIKAIFCGMLMFLAVDSWNQGYKLGIFLAIPAFIFSGFEHCIANSFYAGVYSYYHMGDLDLMKIIGIPILGNGLGNLSLAYLKEYCK